MVETLLQGLKESVEYKHTRGEANLEMDQIAVHLRATFGLGNDEHMNASGNAHKELHPNQGAYISLDSDHGASAGAGERGCAVPTAGWDFGVSGWFGTQSIAN